MVSAYKHTRGSGMLVLYKTTYLLNPADGRQPDIQGFCVRWIWPCPDEPAWRHAFGPEGATLKRHALFIHTLLQPHPCKTSVSWVSM